MRHKRRIMILWLNPVHITSKEKLSQCPNAPFPSACSAGQFGLSYDTNSDGEANSAWTLFTAASIADINSDTRDELVSMVFTRAKSHATQSVGDFPLYYDDATGAVPTTLAGQAR